MRVFRRKGYHYASIRDIAKEAGIQSGSVYYYVTSKEDLLEHALRFDLDEMTTLIQQIASSDLTPDKKLREAITVHLEFVTANMDGLGVFMQDWHSLSPDRESQVIAKRDYYESLFRGIIQEGIKSGDFNVVDVGLITFAIFGMCNYIFVWFRPDGKRSAREIAQVYTHLLLDGLTACATKEGERQEYRSRLAIARRVHSLREALQGFNDVQVKALGDIENELQIRENDA